MKNANNNRYVAHSWNRHQPYTVSLIIKFHDFITPWNKSFQFIHMNKTLHFTFKIPIKSYLSKYKALFCTLLCEKPRKMQINPLRITAK